MVCECEQSAETFRDGEDASELEFRTRALNGPELGWWRESEIKCVFCIQDQTDPEG